MTFIEAQEYVAEVSLLSPGYSGSVLGLWRGAGGFYMGWVSSPGDALVGPLTLDSVAEETVSLWAFLGRRVPQEDVEDFLQIALSSFLMTLGLRA